MKVSSEPTAAAEDVKFVEEGLSRFNFNANGISDRTVPVNIFLRTDEGEIKGGLIGGMQGGWLHIATLWVDEEHRRNDHSMELMRIAEARASGCNYVALGIFEFQAPTFYERLGYECFGALNDHPVGHTHYHMYKRLT